MPSKKISDLHPKIRPLCEELLKKCLAENIRLRVTCTYRSNEEQDDVYAQGRTKPGKIVTNARAGQSRHNTTLGGKPAATAFDVAVVELDGSINWDPSDKRWKRMGAIGRSLGLVWGGDWKFKDYPHFEINLKP